MPVSDSLGDDFCSWKQLDQLEPGVPDSAPSCLSVNACRAVGLRTGRACIFWCELCAFFPGLCVKNSVFQTRDLSDPQRKF